MTSLFLPNVAMLEPILSGLSNELFHVVTLKLFCGANGVAAKLLMSK